jgi:hypothetical protein
VQSLDLDVEVASAICQRLDGLPLALELAAARVSTLGVRGVLAALDDRFNLLTAGRRTALSRHRTLRATVDWSYHLLDSDEQRLFCRLALFASSFDAQAARAVAAPESDDPWFSLDLLSGLVGKSLLLLDSNRATPRYRLLETIRFYALEKLAERGDVDLSAERHAAYFVEITRRASDDWKKLPTEDWRATYENAIDDIRAALDWSFSAKGDMPDTWRLGIGRRFPASRRLLSAAYSVRRGRQRRGDETDGGAWRVERMGQSRVVRSFLFRKIGAERGLIRRHFLPGRLRSDRFSARRFLGGGSLAIVTRRAPGPALECPVEGAHLDEAG